MKNHPASESANRLIREKSPYLLQHAHNPVDWYPWGDEAFEKARGEDKPVFLSIGYSTCHWCHVMDRESFENPDVAKILNDHFVSIKVDREERPDVDRVYMTFVQAATGGGGWPMSVFLTPGLHPFAGGTYFPPEDRHGRPGFPTILRHIANAWRHDRETIVTRGMQAFESLREYAAPPAGHLLLPGPECLQNGLRQIARGFDPEQGGFGGAPKFPRPVTLNFLLRFHARSGNREALEMALFTLRKMAAGGMHDQLGGGFHRYSVDRFWHVPHFEKMLYDQAQLAVAYLDAFQITREPVFETTARGILDYVLRDMTGPEGGFYSAEDADSVVEAVCSQPPVEKHNAQCAQNTNPSLQHGEKAEGAFYVWTKEEIGTLLGTERAEIFNRFYGVESAGNAPDGSDPQGEFEGKNTLIQRMTSDVAARFFNKPAPEIEAALGAARRLLFEARKKRPRPHCDDKIITAWNGLMISAFARAAQVLGEPGYLGEAVRAADFARTHLVRDGMLLRSYRQGAGGARGFADDHAFLIQGLLDLYEASFDIAWLKWAAELQAKQDALFADHEHGGYYGVGADDPHILIRIKEDYDGAEPSSNSVSALNLSRLSRMTGDDALRARAEKTVAAFAAQLEQMPHAMPQMLVALDFLLAAPRQIVIAGEMDAGETQALLREVHNHFIPDKVLLLADGGEGGRWLDERLAFIRSAVPQNAKASAYVCENFACRMPVSNPGELRGILETGLKM